MRQLVPCAAVLALTAVSLPTPAWACSYLASPELSGYPNDGETDVPTDTIPIYFFPSGLGSPSLVLRSSLIGPEGAIEIEPRSATTDSLEFVPARALAPNTTYTLSVTYSNTVVGGAQPTGSATFTTGAGPFEGDLSPPPLRIMHYEGGFFGSCGPGAKGSCFSLPASGLYVTAMQGSSYTNLAIGSFITNMYGADQGHPFECMSVWRRAPNGELGDEARVCTAEGLMYDLRELSDDEAESASTSLVCEPDGLKWRGKLVATRFKGRPPLPYGADAGSSSESPARRTADSSASCSALAGARQSQAALPMLGLLLASLALRRRTRR